MPTIRAHFDGKAFVPDEPVILPANLAVALHVDAPENEPADSVEDRLRALAALATLAGESSALQVSARRSTRV